MTVDSVNTRLDTLGPYQLLEPLGEGGMGQVFRAEHRLMKRSVALKLIRAEILAQPEARQRFLREIQMVAQLSHPNIVAAQHADEIDGRMFLVMEFCDGIDLSRLVQETGPLPVACAADYVRQAALGLAHAFERGMIHRDIKPANLLLVGGVVKVLDFGLARLRQDAAETESTLITKAETFVGTPDFISPEQARDLRAADIRSDLYSLGCTLYYLLSGRVPFPGGTSMEKVLRHQLEKATPLERLRPDVVPELVAVTNKLMAREPAERFQTPQELLTALTPLAASQGSASPTDTLETVPWGSVVPLDPQIESESSAPTMVGARPDTVVPSGTAKVPARSTRRVIVFTGVGASVVLGLMLALAALLGWNPLRRGANGERAIELDRFEAALANAGEGNLFQPGTSFRGPDLDVQAVAFSPNGKLLAAGFGNESFPQNPGEVRVWRLDTLQEIAKISDFPAALRCLAFSPDGQLLAAATGNWDNLVESQVRIYDVIGKASPTTLTLRCQFKGNEGGVYSVAFDTTNKTLATSGATRVIKLWNAATGAHRQDLQGHNDTVNGLAYSPDGRWLASACRDGSAKLWNCTTGKELGTLEGLIGGHLFAIEFSADSQRLAGVSGIVDGSSAQIRLWDVASRRPIAFHYHGDVHALCLALSPRGKLVVTGADDGLARIWEVETGRMLQQLEFHKGLVWCVAWSADGRKIATGGPEGQVKLWRAAGRP